MTFLFAILLIGGGLTIMQSPLVGVGCWVGAYFLSQELSSDSDANFFAIIFLLAIAGVALGFFF